MSLNQASKSYPPFIIAVDGHSSCGKSTLAKALADYFDLSLIDTGAMYRAVTLYMLQNGISLDEISNHLDEINISFSKAQLGNRLILNGKDCEDEIRTPKISHQVSEVSKLKEVRAFLVDQQRKLGKEKNVILEGRDIGTVVYPKAEVKLFVTASIEVRTKRRFLEYISKGITMTMDEVQINLEHRDRLDSTREISPLRKAEDAMIIDNSNLDKDEQLKIAIEMVKHKLSAK